MPGAITGGFKQTPSAVEMLVYTTRLATRPDVHAATLGAFVR
jgi:hypothetical protein